MSRWVAGSSLRSGRDCRWGEWMSSALSTINTMTEVRPLSKHRTPNCSPGISGMTETSEQLYAFLNNFFHAAHCVLVLTSKSVLADRQRTLLNMTPTRKIRPGTSSSLQTSFRLYDSLNKEKRILALKRNASIHYQKGIRGHLWSVST